MGFLTPLFLAGLAALAVPIVIHLIQRERKNVVQFPSLMFLRRIPYESVRRRKVHNWALLLLRLAALALIVAAFARPFLRNPAVASDVSGGAREVVVLVDQSFSMAYGDRWSRASTAARQAVADLGPADRASIVFFTSGANVAVRSTSDRSRLESAIDGAAPSAGATRFGPALKLAGSMLSESSLPRREVVLISDFQRSGWQGGEGLRLPEGATLTPVVMSDSATPNVTVAPVTLQRSRFSGQERVTVTGGVLNHGPVPLSNLEVTLELAGRAVQTQRVEVEARGSASVTFEPITPDPGTTRGVVRIPADALPADNAFHFTLSPRQSVRVVVVDRPGGARDSSLYLSRALALGERPPFETVIRTPDTLTADDIQRAGIVILNDVPVNAASVSRLTAFVNDGGGLLVALGERAAWAGNAADLLPATPGAPVDRTRGMAARLGGLEYGHEIFESFRAPRSGDFSSAHFYGYRAVVPVPEARILARFEDGAPALLERRVGTGRVLLWTSTLDNHWTDLPLKPVYLPFVHRMATSLAAYAERPAWMGVGDVLDSGASATGVPRPDGRVVLTPSGQRVTLDSEGPDVMELSEAGFYEVRSGGRDAEPLLTIAANVDLAESDLAPMDPQDVVAAATGHAGGGTPAGAGAALVTDADHERPQRFWWYLLFAGVLLLGCETVLSNRLSRVRV
ncbi:MAG: BatA domain-containing protein [Acidobacteria bacterium]|nr:BatA domain-containing protein [Acidobacteriota bacterium]